MTRTHQITASWAIRRIGTEAAFFETYDPKIVAALNTEKYEAVPIAQYLGEINCAAQNR